MTWVLGLSQLIKRQTTDVFVHHDKELPQKTVYTPKEIKGESMAEKKDIEVPREPPAHVYVDKYLMRSLDAENQMPPQLPPEMAEYIIMKAKSRRWPCQLLGRIMVIMGLSELVYIDQVLLGFGPNRWMIVTSFYINIFNS
ncbi:hypothetical protein ACFX11_008309 [Malus domestica]